MSIPSLRLHKGTGQSYVYWRGKMIYFGKHGLPATDRAYWRWRESLGVEGEGKTIGDLLSLFEKAKERNRNDKSKIKNLRDALGGIAVLDATKYTPAIFCEHRMAVASTGTRSARQVNDLMKYMRHVIKWAAGKGLVDAEVWSKLGVVQRLDADELERKPVERQPADIEDVHKTLNFLADNTWAMIQLQILTGGARPSEIVSLKKSEIRKDGPNQTWFAELKNHKTAKKKKRRFLVFNKDAQDILSLFMEKSSGDWVFPSEVLLNDHYQESSLRQAVGHACVAAGVKHWTPYQIRHLRGTELSTEHGLQTAADILGHSSVGTTGIYQHAPDADTIRRAS